jgi:hypothetical protein
MTPFIARVRHEGAKTNLCLTVPAPITKQLSETGFRPPGWVRLRIEGHAPIFVVARRPPSRPSVIVTLPVWAFGGKVTPGTSIEVMVEGATPYRARADTDEHDFDWLPYVEADTYLPVDNGAQLQLHSRHEQPFVLDRYPNPQVVGNLCKRGIPSGRDYTITGGDVPTIKKVIQYGLGIDSDRIQVVGAALRVTRSQPLVRLLRAWRAKENARTRN